ncbi:hypothetical protein [Gilliamella sp. W8126]|uniref:hypothetical protein n=1 Tax=Gilliamella sp. W8126 TaxID=2750946 RepID=UPI0018DBE3D9|nr:hypothetical protein [Gilliamella sp. W8126]
MYCRNSIILHLIRGIVAISLIFAVFLFQLPLLLKLFLVVGAFLLLQGCPACWLLSLINKLQTQKGKQYE